jgi:hypothetical protein
MGSFEWYYSNTNATAGFNSTIEGFTEFSTGTYISKEPYYGYSCGNTFPVLYTVSGNFEVAICLFLVNKFTQARNVGIKLKKIHNVVSKSYLSLAASTFPESILTSGSPQAETATLFNPPPLVYQKADPEASLSITISPDKCLPIWIKLTKSDSNSEVLHYELSVLDNNKKLSARQILVQIENISPIYLPSKRYVLEDVFSNISLVKDAGDQLIASWAINPKYHNEYFSFNVCIDKLDTLRYTNISNVETTENFYKFSVDDYWKTLKARPSFVIAALNADRFAFLSMNSNFYSKYNKFYEDRYVREIRRKLELKAKYKAGVRGWLLRRIWRGEKCPVCYNVKLAAPVSSTCLTCFGTGFKGGYYVYNRPVTADLAFVNFDEKLVASQEGTGIGMVGDFAAIGLFYDVLPFTYDIFIPFNLPYRFVARTEKTTAQLDASPIITQILLRPLQPDNIVYKYQIPYLK